MGIPMGGKSRGSCQHVGYCLLQPKVWIYLSFKLSKFDPKMIPFRTLLSTWYSAGTPDLCHESNIFLIVLVCDPINRCSNLGIGLADFGRRVHWARIHGVHTWWHQTRIDWSLGLGFVIRIRHQVALLAPLQSPSILWLNLDNSWHDQISADPFLH